MLIWFPLELYSTFDHIHMLICAIEILNIIITIIIIIIIINLNCFFLYYDQNRYQFRCSDEGKPDSRRKIVRSPSFVKSLPVQVYEIDEKGKLSEQVWCGFCLSFKFPTMVD